MKELSIEEKAKRYVEALERAKLGLIDDAIMNEIVRQLRIKRLEDYTTLELEQELELGKSK